MVGHNELSGKRDFLLTESRQTMVMLTRNDLQRCLQGANRQSNDMFKNMLERAPGRPVMQ
ncbi:MAG: hypothetical protein HQL82_03900 [Magnetococcales bacterium]|nr:hypothetical protein [Magnetococcales bacterium]